MGGTTAFPPANTPCPRDVTHSLWKQELCVVPLVLKHFPVLQMAKLERDFPQNLEWFFFCLVAFTKTFPAAFLPHSSLFAAVICPRARCLLCCCQFIASPRCLPALPGVEDTTPTCTRGCEGKQESSSQRFSITCLTWWPLSSSGVRNGFSRGSALVDNYLEVAVECRKGGRRGSCVSEAAEVAVVTVLGDTALKSRPSNLLAPLLKPPK